MQVAEGSRFGLLGFRLCKGCGMWVGLGLNVWAVQNLVFGLFRV